MEDDSDGNLTTITDAKSQDTVMAYSTDGLVTSITDRLGQVHTTMWESACPGRAVDTARGIQRKFGVDNLCRISEIQAGTPLYYDDIDEISDQRTFHFDELGRLVKTVHLPSRE